MSTVTTDEKHLINDFVGNVIKGFSTLTLLNDLGIEKPQTQVSNLNRLPLMVVVATEVNDIDIDGTIDSSVEMVCVIRYYFKSMDSGFKKDKLDEKASIIRKALRKSKPSGINGFGFNPKVSMRFVTINTPDQSLPIAAVDINYRITYLTKD